MEDKYNCKGCTASTRVSEAEIKTMLDSIVSSGQFKLVDDVVYEHRLNQCRNCNYLQYGNTCRQCGCIVQIRARLSSGTCPNPEVNKW